jgi:hypothetical protein
MTIVIHRDRTFTYKGRTYRAVRQGPRGGGDDCYEVYDVDTGESLGEFYRMYDIRDLLKQAEKEDWPSLHELTDEQLADFQAGTPTPGKG